MVHRFLDFELDETLFELRFRGEVVATQARVFALIAYLLRHRARVIAKEELARELWKAQVVSDTAISQVVMLARKALHDEGDSQRIIKTIRGRGFRFVAPVDSGGQRPIPAARAAPRPQPLPGRDKLIGRDAELELVSERLTSLRNGHGGLVSIEGPPGIGKTALADALAAGALALGLDVQWGRAWAEGGAPPFWPWIQVLRGLLKTEGEASLRALMGRGEPELLALLPELSPAPGTPPAELDRSRGHFRLFDAMARCLAAAAAKAPRVVILDDLHDFDEGSVQLLRFLAPELEQHAICILTTFRDFELQRQPVLGELTGCAGIRRVQLPSLGRAEVASWVERALGAAPAPQLLRTLHEISDGNPLLLAELCRRLARGAPDPLAELAALRGEPMPERIARAVRSHLSELPAPACEVLAAASALGRSSSLQLVAALFDTSEAALLERLAPALQRGIVRHAPGSDELAFSHALVCNAVYAELAPRARLELHRRIAEQLETSAAFKACTDGGCGSSRAIGHAPLYDIAHHFTLAAAIGCRPQALHYSRLAAARAAEMAAYEVAAALYDRCLSLAEAEGSSLHDLLCAAGAAWYNVGAIDQSIARLDRAAQLARADRDGERLVNAAIGAASVLRGAVLYDQPLKRHVLDGLQLLPEGDSALRAGALAVTAITMRTQSTPAERDAMSRDAVAMARRVGEPATLQWVLNARHLALWGALDPREFLPLTEEMVELARSTGNSEVLMDALLWRVSDFYAMGDFESARRAREVYAAEVERVGSPWHRYMQLCCDSFEAFASGEFERWQACSERARLLGVRLRDPLAEPFYAVRTLFQVFHRGVSSYAPGSAELELFRDPPECVPADHRPLWALAWAVLGRRADAERCVAQVLANDRAQLVLDALRRPLLSIVAEVCAMLELREPAAALYASLLPASGLYSHLLAGVDVGPVDYYLGRLATCLGQTEPAAKHFEKVLATAEDDMPLRARALFGYAVALAQQPSMTAAARQRFHDCQALASRLDMADLRTDAQRELERLRHRLEATAASGPAD